VVTAGKMVSFRGLRLKPASDKLVDMIQAQEIWLMTVRADDDWNVERRRFASRRKYLGTADLVQASKRNLKIYLLHLYEKELEVL
jgi:hypothetical protein